MKVHFILNITIRKRFSHLHTIEGISFGLVRIYVTHYCIFWIVFASDLLMSFTIKLLAFQWVQIVILFSPICLFFCYKRDFMTSLSDDNQADITETLNSTSRYLDDLLNIDNPCQPNLST